MNFSDCLRPSSPPTAPSLMEAPFPKHTTNEFKKYDKKPRDVVKSYEFANIAIKGTQSFKKNRESVKKSLREAIPPTKELLHFNASIVSYSRV